MFGIALDQAGIPCRVVDPRVIGYTSAVSEIDSEPIADRHRLEKLLGEFPVVVVPGLFAYDSGGQAHLFGLDGADVSAVSLAFKLRANRCRLVKDVDGVYERDATTAPAVRPRHYAALSYADALECAQPLVQPKAVRYLARSRDSAEIAGIATSYESTIGPFESTFDESRPSQPTSVRLLGNLCTGRHE